MRELAALDPAAESRAVVEPSAYLITGKAGRLTAKALISFPASVSDSLKRDWKTHVASSGYLELGTFDSAAQVLEEIAPQDKNRTAVASHLVKVQPETPWAVRSRSMAACLRLRFGRW